jgi:lysophospholipid acyltransferase (LPLAT)-like uncharacterized protein
MRLLARSWRTVVVSPSPWPAALAEGQPYVLLCWHEVLLPVLWHHRWRGIAAVVSEARDGEYLAGLARSLGYRLIRGSSSRGQTRALLGAVRALGDGIPVGITPDGPRGPRRELKTGALVAAQKAGAVVLPVHAAAGAAWRARSWDRFVVPQPWTGVRLAYGPVFTVAPGSEGLARGCSTAVAALEEAERLAAWSDAGETRIA